MKKSIFFLPAVAGMMFFTACSSEEELPSTGLDNGVQEINLQVSSTNNDLQARAGRPLLSDEAKHEIQNVVLFICDNDQKILYKKAYSDWQNESATYSNGRQTKIVLQGNDKLAAGTYKAYAIGYSDNSDYDLTPVTSLEKGGKYSENVLLKYKEGKTVPEEIFAGALNFTVTANTSFTADVVLTRQVAGAYIYAYNIPWVDDMATDGDKYSLQLVASDANNVLVLGSLESVKDLPANGNSATNEVQYVVNGAKEGNPSTVICTAKLSDWYSSFAEGTETTEGGETKKTGILDNTNWITTTKATDRLGGHYVKGSVFASNFIIPFKKIDEKQTLVLQLVKDGVTEPIRHWNVNYPAGDGMATALKAWNGTVFAEVPDYKATTHCYSIVRNHLYSVGSKSKDGSKDDPDPEKPDPDDPDPDDPEDLSKSQNINLRVNHNWEVIHRMELE